MSFTVSTSDDTTVDVYLDGMKRFSDTVSPYEWTLEGPAYGRHHLSAETTWLDGTLAYAQVDLFVFSW